MRERLSLPISHVFKAIEDRERGRVGCFTPCMRGSEVSWKKLLELVDGLSAPVLHSWRRQSTLQMLQSCTHCSSNSISIEKKKANDTALQATDFRSFDRSQYTSCQKGAGGRVSRFQKIFDIVAWNSPFWCKIGALGANYWVLFEYCNSEQKPESRQRIKWDSAPKPPPH